MSKRPRVEFTLDSGDVRYLTEKEIRMILRATDELIGIGGRNMLVRILKGSKDKKVLEHGLDACPAYGFYHQMTMTEISYRVDWMIEQDYIRIEYRDRLPMLIFSERGWEIEAQTFAEEIYEKFCRNLDEHKLDILGEMKDVNRQVVFDVLEKIRASKNKAFIPMLEAWKEIEVRKVRDRISGVVMSLSDENSKPVLDFRKATLSDANRLANIIQKTVRLQYPRYYPAEVAEFFCLLHSKEKILEDIQAGHVWVLIQDGQVLGTGTVEENHITRVYVPAHLQGKGYGSRIMQELELRVAQDYDTAQLDASLPACRMYEKRGYHTIRHEQKHVFGEAVLVYDVMEKKVR